MEGRCVTVMLSEYGRENIDKIHKYFENDNLTIIRRYSKSLVNPPTNESIFTCFDIVSGNDADIFDLVKEAANKVEEAFPGAVLYAPVN